MRTVLLIDADIVAYTVAASHEDRTDWGEGVVTVETDFEAAKQSVNEIVRDYMQTLEADAVIMCLSDDVNNFRKRVDPTYKTNRSGKPRPELLYSVKDWMTQEFPYDRRPWLEADDVMGILATEPHDEIRIIVSEDKDMQTVPAPLYRPHKAILGVTTPTPEEAERFMFWQAICGDTVDGYAGAPGVGPKKADMILDDNYAFFERHREIVRGARKGEVETKWVFEADTTGMSTWQRVVTAFERSGLTETDAIKQVNLARILKHSDYVDRQVIPWRPN